MNSSDSDLRALVRPSSSRTPGSRRRAMRRISSRLARVVSCTCASCSRTSSGAWSATRLRSSSTAARVCPTSSYSSWATRWRSDSCALSVRAALCARSASSRSSMVLKVVISSAISPSPSTLGRTRGRSRSVVVMACASRRSGPRPIRSSSTLATRITTRPAVRIAASVSRTGVDTVTGPSSSAVAATSTTELNREILQNKDTAAASTTHGTRSIGCGTHFDRHAPPPSRTTTTAARRWWSYAFRGSAAAGCSRPAAGPPAHATPRVASHSRAGDQSPVPPAPPSPPPPTAPRPPAAVHRCGWSSAVRRKPTV
ncbi:hypothetical protein SVIOM342S_10368 [Streptomyces violaceorubidus]